MYIQIQLKQNSDHREFGVDKMKKAVLLGVLLALINCAPMVTVMEVFPEFKNSNQMFIEATVRKVGIAGLAKKHIPVGSRVALISMESTTSTDLPLISIIEDQLISEIVNSGFTILERDQHTVVNLAKESSRNGYSLMPAGATQETSNADVDSPTKTQLLTAQYLISYRVLECGIISSPAEEKELVLRDGMVRLHVRIIDAKSGAILVACMLAGNSRDRIQASIAMDLANYHYSFYSHKYPLQNQVDVSKKDETYIQKDDKKK